MTDSVFAKYEKKVYKHRFEATILAETMAGGVPTSAKKAEGWLKSKLADKDDLIREAVAEVMVERGVDADEAVAIVEENKHLNGFKRDEHGLYYEGRCLKAAIKEGACIRWPDQRWGPTRKGTKSFFAEHVFVEEERLHFGLTEPSGVVQMFVHTFRGNGIQLLEYVEDAKFDFTVVTDYAFKPQEWAELWLTIERNGVGSNRSQGFGTCKVVRWEQVS